MTTQPAARHRSAPVRYRARRVVVPQDRDDVGGWPEFIGLAVIAATVLFCTWRALIAA